MNMKYYQACYGRPDTGWSVINASNDMPKSLVDDFAAIERVNAAAVSGDQVSTGSNETPSCMFELYSKSDAVGLVRVQYHLSDIEGRPISFAHGYVFPNSYEILKNPELILSIGRENYADQRIPKGKIEDLRRIPGALSRELINQSLLSLAPEQFILNELPSISEALERCGMCVHAFKNWMVAVYSQLLLANSQKNLYVKTDGSEEYARNLLLLTYRAIPYSFRSLLSASTYLRNNQRNTKIIFCSELPVGVPRFNPITGETNAFNDVTAKRISDRNPIITAAVDYLLEGTDKKCFDFIESCLNVVSNEKTTIMQSINLAHSIYTGEFKSKERVAAILYNWLTVSSPNSEMWENFACVLIEQMEHWNLRPSEETKVLLKNRLHNALTDDFTRAVEKLLK